MISKIIVKFAAAGAAVGAIALGGLVVASPANAAPSDEGTDPAIRCAAGAYQVASQPMYNRVYNQNQGRIQMMYSPQCGTNWVNLYPGTGANEYIGLVDAVGGPPAPFSVSAFGGGAAQHTLQTNAPGCVNMGYRIIDRASGAWEGDGIFTIC